MVGCRYLVVDRLLQAVHCGDEFFRTITIGMAVSALAMIKSFLTAEALGAGKR